VVKFKRKFRRQRVKLYLAEVPYMNGENERKEEKKRWTRRKNKNTYKGIM
jgi:hypothetical protein